MNFQFTMLWTDALVYVLVASLLIFAVWTSRHEHLIVPWRKVVRNRLGVAALIVLLTYAVIGLLDSIHIQEKLVGPALNGKVHYAAQSKSALDLLLAPVGQREEKTYSAPFAVHLYSKETLQLVDGSKMRAYLRLQHAGRHLAHSNQRKPDIIAQLIVAIVKAGLTWLLFVAMLTFWQAKRKKTSFYHVVIGSVVRRSKPDKNHSKQIPWKLILLMLALVLWVLMVFYQLARHYHVLGTDKVGQDVLYAAIKSIRTGLVIGTLTTLVMLPFAVTLGAAAGYFGGKVDDVIQYLYTTLSSIPAVLLIAAAILSLQIFIGNHPDIFHSLAQRADARLLALCVILGVTSWTSLCRLVRAETLKLREMDYIQAAKALGTSKSRILSRHILPNLMHIILITVVLDFSALVLAEAVLSYVGVGVDPSSLSWGNMINSARLELAREPVVWWPLLAAFLFMFTLVLAANLFADAVRDAFDPRVKG